MNSMDRERAMERLLGNAREVSEKHGEEVRRLNPIMAGGKDFLPGYVPYVGRDYFSPKVKNRRILAYALSQNLTEETPCGLAWARDWKEKGRLALDRQNRAYEQEGSAAMHPFDTGHVPILASLLRAIVSPGKHSDSIYPEIAATNLSKFSFRTADKRQTMDRRESLQRCWEWFSRLEVEVVHPDCILCCGTRVYEVVREHVSQFRGEGQRQPQPILVSFPSVRVINRHYRNKPFRPDHLRAKQIEEIIAAADLGRTVYRGNSPSMTLRERVCEDGYYFAEMFIRMKGQVEVADPPVGA